MTTLTLAPLTELSPDPSKPCCDWSLAFGDRIREAIADDRYAGQVDKLYTAKTLLLDGGGYAVRANKTFPGPRKDEYQRLAQKSWDRAIVLFEEAEEAVRDAEEAELDRLCSECCAPIPSLQCGGLCEGCFAAAWNEYEAEPEMAE